MLTQWRLNNFKPIAEVVDLPLKEITVLAGLNSSGKSSILQSILLVSQTLANPNPEKTLILNGNIVQLGSFDDIRNEKSASPTIDLGFELDTGDSAKTKVLPRPRIGRFYALDDAVGAISLSASFGAISPGASTLSGLDAVKVRLVDATLTVLQPVSPKGDSQSVGDVPDRPQGRVAVTLKPLAGDAQIKFLSGISDEYMRFVPHAEGDNYSATIPGLPQALLAKINHFLPERFFAKFNTEVRLKGSVELLVEGLFTNNPFYLRPRDPARLREVQRSLHERAVSEALLQSLNGIASEAKGRKEPKEPMVDPFMGTTFGAVVEWAQTNRYKTTAKAKFTARIKALLVTDLLDELARARVASDPTFGLEGASDEFPIAILEAAVQKTVKFFSTMVRYLGPLRADPQAPQRFAPSNEPDDVGVKGEFAAAVYEANRDQLISWWDPTTAEVRDAKLSEAVDAWAVYLGIAHHVSTREAGLSGVSWHVQHLPHSRQRPLQALGVGVSQVLPILIAGLLAPRGALILIEQPELHLHARAQAKLGDFFVGLARLGKQCIIETHSDCLVNQLRLRTVQMENSIREVTQIYFVSQDDQGKATFSPIEISSRGNIVNWPEGFFDVSLHQEDEITREAFARARTP